MSEITAPVKDGIANPAPLGLCAFGLTTVLLNLHNSGMFPLNSMILGMGIFYGGIAQVIAGIIEAKKNNTFGLTAFTSYGFFWLSLVGLIVFPKLGWAEATSPTAFSAYLAIWGVFTFCLFFGTLKLNRALQFVFLSLTILFALLAVTKATGSEQIEHIAGYVGIICGSSAIYTGIAGVLNEVYGRTVLPIGAL
ncbi:acetate uptake transporter [Mucilaginibacter myungsuensis]|uniref:Acetate uptake transporter n=1 Tax=Mucilaginibacter myungsuensis TaxID=649104 RepID=A0A929PVH4_9SPHI|nr:acetate uptake transporter [Mucilaginibacter myungsuensis]MBE9660335.1 acetate uptake transporter [Mucilaginibacter myungsuensis]MDN3600377.1 acetate uptake transporter [Mucilaginibacter myungsuensis]